MNNRFLIRRALCCSGIPQNSQGKLRFSLLSFLIAFAVLSFALAWWSNSRTFVAEATLQFDEYAKNMIAAQRSPYPTYFIDRDLAEFCLHMHLFADRVETRTDISQLQCVQEQIDPAEWFLSKLDLEYQEKLGAFSLRIVGPRKEMASYCKIIDAFLRYYESERRSPDAKIVHYARVRAL